MTKVMEDMEDYVEYNDSIEPAHGTASILCGLLGGLFLAGTFLLGRYSYIEPLPTILIHVTHDPKITSLYIDGHEVAQTSSDQLGNQWNLDFHYDLNQEKND